MIKYFTFMVMTYFVQGEQLTYNILFPSYDACSHSKTAMYAITRPHLDDVHIYCKGTHCSLLVAICPPSNETLLT